MYRHREDFGADFGSAIVMLGLILVLLAAFLVVKAVLFVVRTFVKYYKQISLWIALGVCIGSFIGSGLLYKLTAFDGSFALGGIGIAVLLITCLVVDLKNRDTLLRENVSLINEVLHTPWWGSEDTPRQEQELEPVAA